MNLRWRCLALAAGLAAIAGQTALPALHGAAAHAAPTPHAGAVELAASADFDLLHTDCALCLARAQTRGFAKPDAPALLLDRAVGIRPATSARPGWVGAPALAGRGPRAPPPLS